MATSGTFTTSTQSLDFSINWSRTDSGINSSGVGYSTISINVTCTRTNSSYSPYKQTTPYTFTYDSTNSNGSINFNSSGYRTGVANSIYSTSITVLHDSNGDRSVPLTYVLDLSGTSAGTVTIQGTAVLDNIPLATTLSNISNVTFRSTTDNNLYFTPKVYKNTYKHKIQLKVGNTSVYGPSVITLTDNVSTSVSLAAATWIPKIPSNTTSTTATIILTTYTDSNYTTVVGGAQSYNFTISTTIGPTANITAAIVDGYNNNLYSGVSKARLTGSANPRYGETISSISFYQGNTLLQTYTFSGSGNKSQQHTTAVLSGTSGIDFKIVVIDSRGTSTTSTTLTLTPLAYSLPTISTATATRCLSDGILDSAGTYLKVTVAATANGSGLSITERKVTTYTSGGSSVGTQTLSNNTATTIPTSGSGPYSITSTYSAKFEVTDTLGKKSTAVVYISTASRIINVKNTGTGIAFGTFAKTNSVLETPWQIKGTKTTGDGLNAAILAKCATNAAIAAYRDDSSNYIELCNGSDNKQGLYSSSGWLIYFDGTNNYSNKPLKVSGTMYSTDSVWAADSSFTGQMNCGVRTAGGRIYLHNNGSNGQKSLYVSDSNDTGKSIILIDANNNATFNGTADKASSLKISDTRSDNSAPSYYQGLGMGEYVEFKASSTIGLSGAGVYATVITTVPWGDSSGGWPTQVALYNGKLWSRTATNTSTWGSWAIFGGGSVTLHSGTIDNNALTLTNGYMYNALVFLGKPSGGSYSSMTIPRTALSTTEYQYELADNAGYRSFKIKYSGNDVIVTGVGSLNNGSITNIYGLV